MQDLLLVSDPDWQKAAAGDPEFILRATGDSIRNYCGWHISPSITEVIPKLEVGSNGIVMLPSLYVTAVDKIVYYPYNWQQDPYELEPWRYRWFQQGYIEPAPTPYVQTWGYLPNTNGGYVEVTLTHGYECVPNDIKAVAYELASWAAAGSPGGGAPGMVVGGDVKSISSPGFSLSLGGATSLGMNLNADQKDRLNRYKIGGVA